MTFTGIMACGMLWCGRFGQTPPPSIDDEIARLRKELIQTQVDIERTSQEIEKDKKDFEAYAPVPPSASPRRKASLTR